MNLDSVVLFRDFIEDNRTSMEIYSNNLENALKPIITNHFELNSYTPSIPNWLVKCKLPHGFSIRYARYFSYPNQVKKYQGTINHIIDQSYAHLLHKINYKNSIITVHDIIPILAWKGIIQGLTYPHFPLLYKLSVKALSKAKAIIAVSQSTKNDLITHCKLNPDNITVIHNGIDSRFCKFSIEKRKLLRDKLRLPNKDVKIVLIAGFQSYKNNFVSFKVVSKLQQQNINVQLVWLGANNEICEKYSKQANLNNNAVSMNNLSFDQIVELYNTVDCLLFPSLYEGFGFPPLEAMACGTPVVTSNAASIPEVVGNAAIMLPPNNVDGLAEAVKNILENKMLREDYINRGYANVNRFSWKQSALQVFSLYKKILNDKF